MTRVASAMRPICICYGPGAAGTGCATWVASATSRTILAGVTSGTMSTVRVASLRPALSDTVTTIPGEAWTVGVSTMAGLPAAVAPTATPSDGDDDATVNTSPVGTGSTEPAWLVV